MTNNRPFYKRAPTYAGVLRTAAQIKKQCPAVGLFTAGKSVLGRRIVGLTLGNLNAPVLFAGAFHAQEWLTCQLLLRFFDDLSAAYAAKTDLCDLPVRRILQNRGLVLIPLVNPDGVEIAVSGTASAGPLADFVEQTARKDSRSWQANARGVDLNHNYNAGFRTLRRMEKLDGIDSPSPRQYGGEHPHSEPETRAMVSLCRRVCFKRVFAFHSQGEEIYYSYGEKTPANARFFGEVLAASCGYSLEEPAGLASHGGFKDWFIDTFARPGFTIEIGRGENPLPVEELEPIYARLLEMMLIAVLL